MFFSRITFRNQRRRNNIRKVATRQSPKFIRKKWDLFSKPSHIPESIPDNLLPTEVDRNQPPIIRAVRRGGLSLDTSESPMGDKQSSPTVITQ